MFWGMTVRNITRDTTTFSTYLERRHEIGAVTVEPDERWTLHYELTATNVRPIRFKLDMQIKDGEFLIEKSG